MGDFNPSSWSQPVEDLVKEYNDYDNQSTENEVQTQAEEISKSMVRRGLLDPNTGVPIQNSKQSKITRDNARGFSPIGKLNYERIFGHA